MHETVMYDRSKLLAHSDSDALNVEPVVVETPGRPPHVAPLINWGLAPLIPDAVRILRGAAAKLFEAVLFERMQMEPELMPYFRRVTWETMYEPAARSKEGG